jgi:hypothetical protein
MILVIKTDRKGTLGQTAMLIEAGSTFIVQHLDGSYGYYHCNELEFEGE